MAANNTPSVQVAVGGTVLMHVWGQQFEQDITANAYIPTAASTNTAADANLNDVNSIWDFDGTNFMVQADPSDEGFWARPAGELVTNGGFDTDSNWTKGTGWTISGGKAVATSCTNQNLVGALSILIGNAYKVTFTVSDYSGSGTVKPMLGTVGAVSGTVVNANGTYTEILVADANQNAIAFRTGGTAFTGKIDSVSLIEYAITPVSTT